MKPPARRPYGSGTIEQLATGYRARIWISGFRRKKTFLGANARQRAKDWLALQEAEKIGRAESSLASKGSQPGLTLAGMRDEFLGDLASAGRTDRTVKGYRSHADRVLATWGDLRIAEIDGPQLEQIVREMHRRHWSASTIRNRIAALSGMVKLAQRLGWAPARPLPVRRPKATLSSRPDPYTAEEVAALLKAAEEPWQRCAILLGADAGLRRGEMIRVRREHLDERSLTLFVPDRKSGRSNLVPVTRALAKAIVACTKAPEALAVGREVWTTPDRLAELLEPVWLAAGVDGGVRLHRLRHYWASALANEGKATPWELMEWGDWSSLEMVKRYFHAPLRVNRAPLRGLDRRKIAHEQSTGRRGRSVPRGTKAKARAK